MNVPGRLQKCWWCAYCWVYFCAKTGNPASLYTNCCIIRHMFRRWAQCSCVALNLITVWTATPSLSHLFCTVTVSWGSDGACRETHSSHSYTYWHLGEILQSQIDLNMHIIGLWEETGLSRKSMHKSTHRGPELDHASLLWDNSPNHSPTVLPSLSICTESRCQSSVLPTPAIQAPEPARLLHMPDLLFSFTEVMLSPNIF